MDNDKKSFYKIMSLVLAVLFACVGMIFLLMPGGVIGFFNTISRSFGMREAPLTGYQFFLILAAAYMYTVTLLAWLMFRFHENKTYPQLLVHAKVISSLLSFLFFIFHQPFLVYLTNGVVDGAIAVLVIVMYLRIHKSI